MMNLISLSKYFLQDMEDLGLDIITMVESDLLLEEVLLRIIMEFLRDCVDRV
jgi:hypothetical protein